MAAVVVVAVVLGCVFGLSGTGAESAAQQGCGPKEDNKTKGDLASSIIVT